MGYKTPPLRAPFSEIKVSMARENPNLPGIEAEVEFQRTSQEWAQWCARIAQAAGFTLESLTKTAALDFPLVAANGGTQDLTVTVPGVKLVDVASVVSLGLPTALSAGLIYHGFVSADDTVTVRCTNTTAGAINPASATFRIEVRRY